MSRVMLEYVLGWVLGSGICLYQEKLNHVNLVKEGITKTSPCNMQTIFSAVKNMNISIEKKIAQNIDCGHTLEPPCRGGSNKYPQSMFGSKIRKTGIPL